MKSNKSNINFILQKKIFKLISVLKWTSTLLFQVPHHLIWNSSFSFPILTMYTAYLHLKYIKIKKYIYNYSTALILSLKSKQISMNQRNIFNWSILNLSFGTLTTKLQCKHITDSLYLVNSLCLRLWCWCVLLRFLERERKV